MNQLQTKHINLIHDYYHKYKLKILNVFPPSFKTCTIQSFSKYNTIHIREKYTSVGVGIKIRIMIIKKRILTTTTYTVHSFGSSFYNSPNQHYYIPNTNGSICLQLYTYKCTGQSPNSRTNRKTGET